MSQGSRLTHELSRSCQRALAALQDRRPEADVIAVHGDWAYMSVGYIEVHSVSDVFKDERALGIVRIPADFPSGTRPYGIITVPYLERHDDQDTRKQERGHKHARPVEQALGVDDSGFWSWKWDEVSSNSGSDLRKAPDLIRERLRMED